MFHFRHCLRQSPRLFELNISWGNHMSVAEWADTYGIHHWRTPWISYRKLTWVGFEPTSTEFRLDTLTDWAIRPWVQLKLCAFSFDATSKELFVSCHYHVLFVCLASMVFTVNTANYFSDIFRYPDGLHCSSNNHFFLWLLLSQIWLVFSVFLAFNDLDNL